MAAGRVRKIIRGTATGIACVLTIAVIGLLLLACWTPALLGAPPDDQRPRTHWWQRHGPPPRHP